MATLVMLLGIGFITVITASITSSFVQRYRQQQPGGLDPKSTAERLQNIDARLERIEEALTGRN